MRTVFFTLAVITPLIFTGWSLLHPFLNSPSFFYPALALYLILTGFVLYLPISFRLAHRASSEAHGQKNSVRRWRKLIVSWLTYFGMGFLSFALTFSVIREVLTLIMIAVHPASAPILQGGMASLIILAFVLGALTISIYLALYRVRLEGHRIPIPDLPAALEGFQILQLSDIHLGPTIGEKFLTRILQTAKDLERAGKVPDIVVITGDIADAIPADVKRGLDVLDQLPHRLGRFYVYGNHELYWGAEAWIAEMRARHYEVLNNESRVLKLQDATIAICGVTDTASEGFLPHMKCDPVQALKGVPKEAIRVLLCHQPHHAPANAKLGYDLQLSGHTHGGQFAPWVWAIYLFQPFVKGLYTVERMQLYVHRGTGTWGPPFRLGSPPELALLTLIRA